MYNLQLTAAIASLLFFEKEKKNLTKLMGKEKMGKRFTKTFSSFIVTLHKKHSNLNF